MAATPDAPGPCVLFIGGGNMAAAMIGGLLRQPGGSAAGGSAAGGSAPGEPASRGLVVTVVEPEAATRTGLEQRFGIATRAGADPGARVDAIVLAVKPQVAALALDQARPLLQANPDAVLVSIAAGTTLATLGRASGGHRAIARAMPNTPALIGEGVTGLFLPEGISDAQAALAERIVASTGAVVRLGREAELDAVTAVSGSGPAYVFYLIEAMMTAARAEGLSEAQARTLVKATVRGAALLADQSDEPAEELRRRVTSPNGTTAAATAEFDRRGVMAGIVAGIAAARQRSEALGRD